MQLAQTDMRHSHGTSGPKRRYGDMAAAGNDLGAFSCLPAEIMQKILAQLDAASLARLEAVSTAFRGRHLTEGAAQEAVLRLCGDPQRAARWR